MKTPLKYSLLLLAILTLSCKKEIDVSLPDSERKIVLNAPLVTNQFIDAAVIRSSHIQDGTDNLYTLNNATVDVYCNGNFMEKLPLVSDGYYASATNRAITGNEYEFRVSSPNLASVTGKTTIPEPTAIIKVDTGRYVTTQYEQYLPAKVTFKDNGETKDYYRIWFYLVNSYIEQVPPYFGDTIRSTIYLNSYNCNDPALDFISYNTQSYETIYLTDRTFDGKEYSFEFKLYAYEMQSTSTKYLVIGLDHLTQDYYYYCKSVEMQAGSEDIPIFTQMVTVYNNIEGGFGIVGGLATSTDSILNKKFRYN